MKVCTSSINLENDVGKISLLQPTFAGRNATFTFTPSTATALGDIKWKYMNGSDVHTIERDYKQFIVYSDGNSSFLTILDADQSLNGIIFYMSFDDDKQSPQIGLILKDYTIANGCGEMYLLSEKPVFSGDNLSFGYYPSPAVAKWNNASKYSIELVNSNNDDHTSIVQTQGVLELHQVGHEYIFTVFNVKKNTRGNSYRVQCSNGRVPKISNTITLSVKGMPVIGPLANISTCRECIVLKADQTLAEVYCTTDGEYDDANVTFKIGLIAFSSASRSLTEFGLQSREKPSDDMHRLNTVCTVSGIYRNVSVEAQIYVVDTPEGPPHLSASQVLLEGEAVNITCTSSKARPTPKLKLFVGKSEILTNVSSTFDNKTGLYKSVLKLHTFQKEWGNKKMWCQQLSEIDGLYKTYISEKIRVEYKYPPLRLNLDVIDLGNQSKEIAVSCSAFDSNPVCNITWESSIENFKYSFNEYGSTPHTSISTIRFNVTDADFGKQIRCRTKCPDFNNTLSNATDVIFAKKPSVVINSSSVIPVPPASHLALTCASNAFPFGNITWQLLKASNSHSSYEKVCLNASTCTYEMTTSDVEQEYLCIAKNEHGTDRRTISVTIRKNKHNEELTGKDSGTLGVIFGYILAGIAFLSLIALVVWCLCRRQKQAKQQLKIDENQTEMAQLPSPTATDTDEVTHEGAEYAVINKTRRDPENVAPLCSKDMPSREAKNECLGNAATVSLENVKQPSIENGVSAQEPGPSTQQDARTAAERDDVTHARMDGAEYAVIDKTHRDPKLVALPSRKDISSCKGDNERLDNAATESSVNVEQPSLEKRKHALERGPSRQPNVR
ncbi:uncharacterized protein LOC128234671 isoform X2 [Mya arenaria]|uniref:uncharacterized protein LOC128234671 isoform X2 n=1 Tax=Mya arenaria TaxID=6604 RepID=UPI0022E34E81|nr:uncharacterized protein LOC128234671 isoform X2 [Mya arenaria]